MGLFATLYAIVCGWPSGGGLVHILIVGAIWVAIIVMLGVLAWTVMRSKAPAPELKA